MSLSTCARLREPRLNLVRQRKQRFHPAHNFQLFTLGSHWGSDFKYARISSSRLPISGW